MPHSLVHALLVFLVMTSLVFLSILGPLNYILDWGRTGMWVLISPLVGPLTKFKDLIAVSFELKELAKRNVILTQQVSELVSEVAVLEKAKQENRFLSEALGFISETKLDLIPAEVVAWDPLNPEPKVTLNRGQENSVAKGDAVIIPGGILVGVISEAFDRTSQMEILTSSAVVVNAEVAESGARGLVKGQHGLGMIFDLVPQTEKIREKDKLVTSGLGGQYPKGLFIGEIGEVNSSESDLFQKANVIPGADFRNLRTVFVVKK